MRAYIGLGSNLGDPKQQVSSAIEELSKVAGIALLQASSLYASPPMGPQDQPDYINAVACIETSLSALDLLAALQHIEQTHGRIRLRHWGERTLDLDLLLFGDEVIQLPTLTVPHPGIAERAFVLHPLAEIAPTIDIPELGNIVELKAKCVDTQLTRLEA
jgi:2-amino-4-hydroxy-6-hydroxymethyldihydropteridine diphosphokinase